MTTGVNIAGLHVDPILADFIDTQALPGTGVTSTQFWDGFAKLVAAHGPSIRSALQRREDLQQQIDTWHLDHKGAAFDAIAYQAFLTDIGYLMSEPDDCQVTTSHVDPEIAHIPGPQLIAPLTDARCVLDAVNARWGSLYDALCHADAIGPVPAGGDLTARIISWGRDHLDRVLPLVRGSWADVTSLALTDDGVSVALQDPKQFAGYAVDGNKSIFLFRCNSLYIEVNVDPFSKFGTLDRAGISDIRLESAVTVIMDCADTVATVDGADKVRAYGNWLGLMKGDLTATVNTEGHQASHALHPDVTYTARNGVEMAVKGRALMLVRNVGHRMTTPAVLDGNGDAVSEGLLDAMCTTLIAMHDLQKPDGPRNALAGSIYILKPDLHGPDEVALTDAILCDVEASLGLAPNTVKLGISGDTGRTCANLTSCIMAAHARIAFINTTGFDRLADEVHTSMEAGPMLPMGDMNASAWVQAYEDRNVDIGLACGMQGRGQIGKEMWATPDHMRLMLDDKIGDPMAGANCALVPSPAAATLHATHYHRVDVFGRQAAIRAAGPRAALQDELTRPVGQPGRLSAADMAPVVADNALIILGYVVGWVNHGIGWTKVTDINGVARLVDRATCRLSAQTLANWLHHDVISAPEVMTALRKAAVVVDRLHESDAQYIAMSPDFDGIAFQAACDLIFQGRVQPSGCAYAVLSRRRQQRKNLR